MVYFVDDTGCRVFGCSVVDNDVCSCAAKSDSDVTADTATGAGDNGSLALEFAQGVAITGLVIEEASMSSG